jgi:signal transduction histidine kinase
MTLLGMWEHGRGRQARALSFSRRDAVKHARARSVVIRLEETDGRLQVTVRDDGSGLPAKAGRSPGIGLRVMRHRANVIGARLTVDSRRGEGVVVRCSLNSPAQ